MDQHVLVMTLWLGTGALGLVAGMVAVSVAKRRLPTTGSDAPEPLRSRPR